jgi:hypothetical protein
MYIGKNTIKSVKHQVKTPLYVYSLETDRQEHLFQQVFNYTSSYVYVRFTYYILGLSDMFWQNTAFTMVLIAGHLLKKASLCVSK